MEKRGRPKGSGNHERINAIIAAYQEVGTVQGVAVQFGISHQRVSAVLKAAGVQANRRGPKKKVVISPNTFSQIIKRCKELQTVPAFA